MDLFQVNRQIISMVVAMNNDRVIGINNTLPWHVPEDLKHFKTVTLHKPIIMGRKTFESIGRVLPDRKNIVITRQEDFTYPGVVVNNSLEEAIEENLGAPELCIIGGGEIFKQAINMANKMYITIIDMKVDLNSTAVYFPVINEDNWSLKHKHSIKSVSGVFCTFKEFIRIK